MFDMNTEHKFRTVLSNNIFTFDNEDIYYTWENDFSEEDKLCDFYLTFFVKNGETYERFDEVHTERAYTDNEICTALSENGFRVKKKLDGFQEVPSHENSERVFYVCENIDSIQMKNLKTGR